MKDTTVDKKLESLYTNLIKDQGVIDHDRDFYKYGRYNR